MNIVVLNHVTLDGVMQGPSSPDEDRRGGFTAGGWAERANDASLGRLVGERFASPGGGLLLGRRSYGHMLAHWNETGGPYRDQLNDAEKHVVSSDPSTPVPWPSSSLVSGDVIAALTELKRAEGGDLVIMGSGKLIRSLLPHGLIDEFVLLTHPVILGSGQRLFGSGRPVDLRLTDTTTSEGGVTMTSYEVIGSG